MVGGLFVLWMGLRSVAGTETTTEHLHGGVMEEITCEDGVPVEGKGIEGASAKQECAKERGSQRGRAPLWIIVGLGIAGYGMFQFRRVRA